MLILRANYSNVVAGSVYLFRSLDVTLDRDHQRMKHGGRRGQLVFFKKRRTFFSSLRLSLSFFFMLLISFPTQLDLLIDLGPRHLN